MKVLIILLLVNLLMVGFHLLWAEENRFFNLDETGLAAYYSGALCFLTGAAAVDIFIKSRKKLWLIMGLFSFGLAVCQVTDIHAGIARFVVDDLVWFFAQRGFYFSRAVWIWPIMFSPIVALTFLFLFLFIKYALPRKRIIFNFYLAGILLFIIVVGFEVLGGFLRDRPAFNIFLVIEELSEMMGITFILYSLLYSGQLIKKEAVQGENIFMR